VVVSPSDRFRGGIEICEREENPGMQRSGAPIVFSGLEKSRTDRIFLSL
jgi:hypothetical protein